MHDADRDRLLRMDVSSDEGDVVPSSAQGTRSTRSRTARSAQPRVAVRSAALSVNTGRLVRLRRPARSATSRAQREASESFWKSIYFLFKFISFVAVLARLLMWNGRELLKEVKQT